MPIFFFLTHSLQAFVKDASSFSHEAVDRLLDVLTEGAHSKYLKQMAEVIAVIRLVLVYVDIKYIYCIGKS